MHKQLPAWQLIQSSLQQKIAVMLLYVLQSKGSSPGRQGFMMAVNVNGEMSGSLGGGIMEQKFVELAKVKLKQTAEEVSVHHQLHDKQAAKNQSGMICSGEQTIFLYTVHVKDSGAIKLLAAEGDTVKVGQVVCSVDTSAKPTEKKSAEVKPKVEKETTVKLETVAPKNLQKETEKFIM